MSIVYCLVAVVTRSLRLSWIARLIYYFIYKNMYIILDFGISLFIKLTRASLVPQGNPNKGSEAIPIGYIRWPKLNQKRICFSLPEKWRRRMSSWSTTDSLFRSHSGVIISLTYKITQSIHLNYVLIISVKCEPLVLVKQSIGYRFDLRSLLTGSLSNDFTWELEYWTNTVHIHLKLNQLHFAACLNLWDIYLWIHSIKFYGLFL